MFKNRVCSLFDHRWNGKKRNQRIATYALPSIYTAPSMDSMKNNYRLGNHFRRQQILFLLIIFAIWKRTIRIEIEGEGKVVRVQPHFNQCRQLPQGPCHWRLPLAVVLNNEYRELGSKRGLLRKIRLWSACHWIRPSAILFSEQVHVWYQVLAKKKG